MLAEISQIVWHRNFNLEVMNIYSESNTTSINDVIKTETNTSAKAPNYSTEHFSDQNSTINNQELGIKGIPVFGAIEFFALTGNAF